MNISPAYKEYLTIVMPLYGRFGCTDRVLKYMNDIEVPFRILIADGGGENLESWIKERNFSNLDIQYSFFGKDRSIIDYMDKMNSAFSMVSTPFSLIMDNDDFISLPGVFKGISFLNNNPDYSSFRGGVFELWLDKKASIYKTETIDNDSPFFRIKEGFMNLNPAWHNICHTSIRKLYFNIISLSKTSDFQLIQRFETFFHLLFGKSLQIPEMPFYFCGPDESLIQNRNMYYKSNEWIHSPDIRDSIGLMISFVGNYFGASGLLPIDDAKIKWGHICLETVYKWAAHPYPNGSKLILDMVEYSKKFDNICIEATKEYAPLELKPVDFPQAEALSLDEEFNSKVKYL